MEFLKYVAAPFIVIYGLLAMLAGPQQWRKGNITSLSANAMLASGVILVIAGYLVWVASSWALLAVGIGLIGMHVVTISNGQHIQGKITWSHHIGRLILSLALFALSYMGTR